jgi:hypothetical protein
MGTRVTRFTEIVIRILRSTVPAVERGTTDTASPQPAADVRTYDAYIYSTLTIPHLDPVAPDPRSGIPSEIAGLPLVGLDRVVIRWDKYREYRTAFVGGQRFAYAALRKLIPSRPKRGAAGDASPAPIGSELFEPASPALKAVFTSDLGTGEPIRVWWSPRDPQLAHLPWELLAFGTRGAIDKRLSFVRGIPPGRAVRPRVPVAERLRIAFIHEPERTQPGVLTAFDQLQHDERLEIVSMTEPPLQALQTAVRDGYEIIHLVADATVSPAQEAILYLPKVTGGDAIGPKARNVLRGVLWAATRVSRVVPARVVDVLTDKVYEQLDVESCAPGELSAMLRGSRAAILCLSPTTTGNSEGIGVESLLLPSVYKAFARLGASPLPLPTMVAPLVATLDAQLQQFWAVFYSALARSHSVEDAGADAQAAAGIVPAAVFLRQRAGREFVTNTRAAQLRDDPSRITADLEAARELLEQLKAIDSKYTRLTDNLSSASFIDAERGRQQSVAQQLEALTELDDDEQ